MSVTKKEMEDINARLQAVIVNLRRANADLVRENQQLGELLEAQRHSLRAQTQLTERMSRRYRKLTRYIRRLRQWLKAWMENAAVR